MTLLNLQVRLYHMQVNLDLEVPEAEGSGDAVAGRRSAHVRQALVFRQRSEESFLVSDLRSLIPDDDASVWIRRGLNLIDLSCLRELYCDRGGIAYDPVPMLGILLYAYHEGVPGSRTIEARCRRDVCYMYVGYGQRPDDRTIRRFRRRVGPALGHIFQLVVEACKEHDALPLRRVAIDGTKVASAASQARHWLSKAEKEDIAEMGLEAPECSDPDARTIKGRRGFLLGYNCQAAVDCDSGVSVAIDVTNVGGDGGLLGPMAERVVQNAGEPPAQVVADAGYDSNEAAQACHDLGIEPIIAQHDSTNLFWSVTQDDEIVCPMGNPLTPTGPCEKFGKTYQVLKVVGCSDCVFFRECCGKSNARTLSFPEGCDPMQRMNSGYRARSPEGRLAMLERMAKVEPVFGDIKSNKGLDRFVLRGEDGVRIEWSLVHLARNLRILGRALLDFLLALLQALGARNRSCWIRIGAETCSCP